MDLANGAMGISQPVPDDEIIGAGGTYLASFSVGSIRSPDPVSPVPEDGMGSWVGLSNAFLGWMVDVPGGSPHFGWRGLSVDSALNITVHDFAIESEANTPIRAGQGRPVPEPGTLALLALGAAGLAAWRGARTRG